ncbi:WD40 repeat domain-containing protein, partial [Winogradskyella sp. DF17]
VPTETTTYTVTGTDANGCENTAEVTVTVTPKTDPTFDPVVVCADAILTPLPTTSNNGITGTWSPALDINTTNYEFTPDAGQCANTASLAIRVNPLPEVTFTAQEDLCIDGGILTGLGGGLPTGGEYSGPGVTDDGNGETYSFDPSTAGAGLHDITYTYATPSSDFQQLGLNIEGYSGPGQSGLSVSISANGNRVAFGEKRGGGKVRIYEYNGSTWSQLGGDLNGNNSDRLGSSVSISADGNRVAIGAPGPGFVDIPGKVVVYEYVSGSWIQLGTDIVGETNRELFGFSVSMSGDGNRLVIGALAKNDFAGEVAVFEFNNGSWIQLGGDLEGDTRDYLGYSVSINADGNRIALGSGDRSGFGQSSDKVRTYEYSNGNWVQFGATIEPEASDVQFGSSLSLNDYGNRLAVVSEENSKVFEWNGNNWVQMGLNIDLGGLSISMSGNGNTFAVGNGNVNNSGITRVYSWNGSFWSQVGTDISGDLETGRAIALSGNSNNVAVGASRFSNLDRPTRIQVFSLTNQTSCTNSTTDSIEVFELPIVTATASATEICEGEEVTLTGGGADTYLWDNGVTDNQAFVPTETTTYTVTGTDANGCENTAEVTV